MNKTIINTTIGLLLSAQVSAQTDTICEMVSGKCNYKFDYNTNKRLVEYDTCKNNYQSTLIKLNTNEVLCLDLYDEVNKKQLLFRRKITVYYRDGSKESKIVKSKDNYFYLSGEYIKEVKISKPKI